MGPGGHDGFIEGAMTTMLVMKRLAALAVTIGLILAEAGMALAGDGQPSPWQLGFQQPAIAGTYMVAMVLLGLHLIHGLNSVWQTFGINHPRWNPVLAGTGPLLGTLIVGGYMAIPGCVLAGIIRLPPGVTG